MLEVLRRKAWTSLYFFTKYILGYSDLEVQPHWEVCRFVEENYDHDTMLLLPRGTFKSTITTIAYPIWRLWDDPVLHKLHPKFSKYHNRNLRVLITGAEYENSKKFLVAIRDHIENNRLLRSVCGDMDPKGKKVWSTEELAIATRDEVGIPQSSITAASISVTKVSQHYDLAVVDDLVTDKVVATRTGIDKAMEYLNHLLPILDPQSVGSSDPGPRLIVGTRWRYNDPYGKIIAHDRLLTKDKLHGARWRKLIRKAHSPGWEWVFFPTRFSKEYLERLRNESGLTPYQYSCQYLNDPIAEGDQPFKLSRVKFYHPDDLPRVVTTFTVVDPAIGQTDQSNWTALVTVSLDSEGIWWVRQALRGRWLPDKIIDMTWEVFEKFRPSVVGVESVAYQKSLYLAMRASQAHRGRLLPVTELRPETDKSKEKRIFGLVPFWSSGRIRFLADPKIALNQEQELLMNTALEGQDVLLDEAVHYPLGESDDCIDALAYIPYIAYPSRVPAVTHDRNDTFDAWRRMALQRRAFGG